jgi:hypothetical protein
MLMRRKYSGGMFAGVDDSRRSMAALAHSAKNCAMAALWRLCDTGSAMAANPAAAKGYQA